VAPWAAIVLVQYWVFAKERIDVDALFDPPGGSRITDVNWGAIFAFLAGIVATWAFSYGVPSFLQGPGAKALANTDLSWLAGSLVAGVLYYVSGVSGARRAYEPAKA
jgi:cytosine/uracil/thiamine/allantoin permease